MLTHIHIKNFIIVKSLSLDFQKGLHVLTGETGAGKSIWIDAIEIGLGGRADAPMIYPTITNALFAASSIKTNPLAQLSMACQFHNNSFVRFQNIFYRFTVNT